MRLYERLGEGEKGQPVFKKKEKNEKKKNKTKQKLFAVHSGVFMK